MTLRDPDTKPGRGGKARLPNPDEEYLSSIVYGVLNQSQKYEDKIENVLEKKWSVSRLDVLMRALLNAASYEIAERKEIPTGILIAEYTDLAHVFFDDKDASFAAMVINQMTIDR